MEKHLSMRKLNLPIRIISVITSNDYYDKTELSLLRTLDKVNPLYGAYIICPQKPATTSPNINVIEEKIDINYSLWLLKRLNDYLDDGHLLVHQWDSCVIDETKWSNEFLDYDYIGALWAIDGTKLVGNGGFSLRSKKFLVNCTTIADSLPVGEFILGNEDYHACHTAYNYMIKRGVQFPSFELARQFSVERPTRFTPHNYNDLSTYKSFGFHGDFNTAGMEYINANQNQVNEKS